MVRLARRASGRRLRLWAGLLASLAVHLALLAGFVLSLNTQGAPKGLPATIVTFWPALRAPSPDRPHRRIAPRSPTPGFGPSEPEPIRTPAPLPVPQAASPLPHLDLGAAMKRSLGCVDPDLYRLTAVERDACARRGDAIQRDVRPLPLIIDPAKTDRWDAVLARRRKPPGPGFTPCPGPGSNFGVGCP